MNTIKNIDKKNIVGQKFGRLTVIELFEERKQCKCLCDCGKVCTVSYGNLVREHTRSCGCLKSPDLTGKRFGTLTVVRRSNRTAPRGKRRVPLWECRCDCGEITYKATDALNNPAHSSCAQCAAKHAVKMAREAAGYIGGTQISRIKERNLTAANTSGVRGVYFEKKSNKWRARLRFKGKIMDFGSYDRFEDAVAARKEAERQYFDSFLEEELGIDTEGRKQ